MPRTRVLAIALLGSALAALAAVAPSSSAATFTWTQHSVGSSSGYTEPSISVRDDGRIVVCAPGSGNQYWVSSNGGTSFTRRSTAGVGGDCEIEFLDNGTLVSSDLQITTSKVMVSADGGLTWTEGGEAGSEQDRQWFAHRGSTLYSVYHSITHEYEFYVKSTDGGVTWSTPYPVNSPDQLTGLPSETGLAQPGDSPSPVDQGYNTFSGPMVVDPASGDLYVVWALSDAITNVESVHGFGAARGIVVAHSTGTGTVPSWTNKYAVVNDTAVPGTGDTNASIFPWVTVDSAGTVYVLYNSNRDGHFHTYYVYSTDKTATWSAPVQVDGNPAGTGSTVFVTGKAGAPGVLDVAWMQSDVGSEPNDASSVWHVDFAQVRSASTAAPVISRSRISDHVIHYGSICTDGTICALGGDRSLGDFFELTYGTDGMAQVAWADNGPGSGRIYWAKQTSGPSVLTP